MYSKTLLIGNLGADPEMRTTQSGKVVCKLRVATSKRVKDSDGKWGDVTEWHRVTCWGNMAESVGRYMSKGSLVFIEGENRTTKWQDAESGKDRYSTEVVAWTCKFLDKKTQDPQGGGHGGPSGHYNDDDAPF